jgi:hypothetical protein
MQQWIQLNNRIKLYRLITVLIFFLLTACSPDESVIPQTTAPYLIFSQSGKNGAFTTDTFIISKNKWYIESTCTPDKSNYTTMLILVQTPDSNNPVTGFGQQEPGTVRNYVYKKGTFYLTINAPLVNTWDIKVYQ